jgi:hypothetical protein
MNHFQLPPLVLQKYNRNEPSGVFLANLQIWRLCVDVEIFPLDGCRMWGLARAGPVRICARFARNSVSRGDWGQLWRRLRSPAGAARRRAEILLQRKGIVSKAQQPHAANQN